jgi:copper resistance protein B
MKTLFSFALAVAYLLLAHPSIAEPFIWGVQVEQLEAQRGESDANVFVWDFDAVFGTDELKAVWRSEAELVTGTRLFETLENQFRLQKPISTFFDAAAGVRLDTARGRDRVYGVIGVKGLAPQWFEIDADLYLSENPIFRFEAEYEALITNRLILIPSIEVEVPLADDRPIELGAWGPKTEVGARLGYDLIDRFLSPYLGVHYERAWGETADLRRVEGEDDETFYLVVGLRMLF